MRRQDDKECKRCGWTWASRKDDVRQCPRCKSARFDEPILSQQELLLRKISGLQKEINKLNRELNDQKEEIK